MRGRDGGRAQRDAQRRAAHARRGRLLDALVLPRVVDAVVVVPHAVVREFVLDEENLVAEEVWSYIRDPGVYVYAKGDVERLSNGNTLVTWSSSGEIQEVQPDGTVQWQVNTELGAANTFVNRVDSLYAR